MTRRIYVIALSFVICIITGTAWAVPQMNPGLWKITTRTEMAGMPTQSLTHTQCITKNDLVPMDQNASNGCQVTDMKIIGNTVNWKISCGGQDGGMSGTGTVTYSGNHMDGSMDMVIHSGNVKVRNTLSGDRVGNCSGSATSKSTPATDATQNASKKVADTLTQDAQDVGSAAKDEAKSTIINEVREGVRDIFHGIFK